jgi:hypothetical protein
MEVRPSSDMGSRLLSGFLSVLAILGAAAPASAFDIVPLVFVPVPEPGTFTLLATGAAALAGLGWLRRRK